MIYVYKSPPLAFLLFGRLYEGEVEAATVSEARAALKRRLGIKHGGLPNYFVFTPRGVPQTEYGRSPLQKILPEINRFNSIEKTMLEYRAQLDPLADGDFEDHVRRIADELRVPENLLRQPGGDSSAAAAVDCLNYQVWLNARDTAMREQCVVFTTRQCQSEKEKP